MSAAVAAVLSLAGDAAEALVVAAAIDLLERWGHAEGKVDISPWAPAHIRAAWTIALGVADDATLEIYAHAAAWADMAGAGAARRPS